MEERKIEVLKKAEIYMKEDYDKIKYRLDNIKDEKELSNYIDYLEKEIESKIVKNDYYANDKQETYYADINDDNKVYDVKKSEDAKIVEDALNKATDKYIDVDPLTLTKYSDYSSLTKVSVLYDDQIGYRVVEDPNGKFHGILIESTWYVYPSKDLNLDDAKNIEICNALFTKNKNSSPYNKGDVPVLDNVMPAQIFSPYQAVVDDPINNLTYSSVLIGEGITVDEKFKDGKVKDVKIPNVKNTIIEKGILTTTVKEMPVPVSDTFNPDLKEELIVGSTKYIDGTFIPYPRDKKDKESFSEYEEYLQEHYAKYGYKTEYVDGKRKKYPHEIILEKNTVSTPTPEEKPIENKFEKFDVFLSSRYKNVNFAKLPPSVQVSYLNLYKIYLNEALKKYPDLSGTITSDINDVEESIDSISHGRIF